MTKNRGRIHSVRSPVTEIDWIGHTTTGQQLSNNKLRWIDCLALEEEMHAYYIFYLLTLASINWNNVGVSWFAVAEID